MKIPEKKSKTRDDEAAVPATAPAADTKPWHKLRGTGELLAEAGESVFEDSDFEACAEGEKQV